MKRTQKCFDLQNLEIDTHIRRDSKRYRFDSEHSDFSMDTDLSDISEDFEKSAVITPTAASGTTSRKSAASTAVSVDMILCQFEFEREDCRFGSSSQSGKSELGNSMRKRGIGDQ